MKRIALLVLAVTMVAALVAGASTAFAAKPTNVIENSNGFPSGMHFNLNIHGKKAEYVCDPNSGGRSVFVLEYGNSTIQYVQNKRASITELTVVDSCAEYFDTDPAVVQLPYQIMRDDGSTIPAEGYYVYAAIKGKPQNGLSGNESSIVLWPNPMLTACNITNPDPSYGSDLWTCPHDDIWILGLITSQGVYDYDPGDNVFVRFDPPTTDSGKGKGKSAGKDITGLFTWSGWVGNQTEFDALDIAEPYGELTDADVPVDLTPYEPDIWNYDADDNDVIDINEWLDFAADELGIGTFYHGVWVFDIADIVIQDQKVVNDGAKLLQIRFYPVATTIFTP